MFFHCKLSRRVLSEPALCTGLIRKGNLQHTVTMLCIQTLGYVVNGNKMFVEIKTDFLSAQAGTTRLKLELEFTRKARVRYSSARQESSVKSKCIVRTGVIILRKTERICLKLLYDRSRTVPINHYCLTSFIHNASFWNSWWLMRQFIIIRQHKQAFSIQGVSNYAY